MLTKPVRIVKAAALSLACSALVVIGLPAVSLSLPSAVIITPGTPLMVTLSTGSQAGEAVHE